MLSDTSNHKVKQKKLLFEEGRFSWISWISLSLNRSQKDVICDKIRSCIIGILVSEQLEYMILLNFILVLVLGKPRFAGVALTAVS